MDAVEQAREAIRDAFGIEAPEAFLVTLRLELRRLGFANQRAEDLLQLFVVELFFEINRKSIASDSIDATLMKRVLWRVSKRITRELGRSRSQRQLRWDPIDDSSGPPGELHAALTRALESMDLDEAVVIKRMLDGMTRGEIADELGIPYSTICRTVDRAMQKLRDTMKF